MTHDDHTHKCPCCNGVFMNTEDLVQHFADSPTCRQHHEEIQADIAAAVEDSVPPHETEEEVPMPQGIQNPQVPLEPQPSPETPHPDQEPAKSIAAKMEVVVTDIRMPFGSMVVFLIKWALAAIPAIIILAVIGAICSAVFMGGCASMLGRHF